METTETPEELDVESTVVRAARLAGFASLGFWPLFVFADKFMLEAPQKTAAALLERNLLVDGTWLYPVAVLLAWFLARRSRMLGRTDVVCLLPWLLPALVVAYWPVYFFL